MYKQPRLEILNNTYFGQCFYTPINLQKIVFKLDIKNEHQKFVGSEINKEYYTSKIKDLLNVRKGSLSI